MKLSDKQKAFLKKLLLRFLRFSGWVLLPFMLLIAESLFDQTYTVLLYGPAYITRHCIVYGSELGSFLFTNPGEVILHTVKLLLLIGGIIYAAACLTMFALNKAKLFPKIINKDKFLLAALIYSVVALTFSATEFSKVHTAIGKFYAKVRECQTIADYEKLCGKAVWQKTVDEKDSEFVNAIAKFDKSGFKAGRELHIFKYSKPEVYLLVWCENGKIVHRNWCHQSAAKGNKTLLPWGCDFYIDKTGECYIRNPQGDIVFFAQKESSFSTAKSAAEAEVARYLNCFKTPIEIKKREDNFQCGGWQGTYLQIVVPARKTVLNTFILANNNMMIFLSGKENFTEMELAELLNQINPVPIYEHFQRGMDSDK